MRTVSVGSVVLGEGRPKICVPLTAENLTQLESQAHAAAAEPAADLVEWRADWYRDLEKPDGIWEGMRLLRSCLGTLPVLFTIRTKKEGGEADLELKRYQELILEAARQGADAVDVELSGGDSLVRALADPLHRNSIPMIVSSHDFNGTPDTEEMVSRLIHMHRLGADCCKLAVMPADASDVVRLLDAVCRFRKAEPDALPIVMAMGKTGVVSRISGKTFGSVLTFGTVGCASAPGQLAASELRKILEILEQEN